MKKLITPFKSKNMVKKTLQLSLFTSLSLLTACTQNNHVETRQKSQSLAINAQQSTAAQKQTTVIKGALDTRKYQTITLPNQLEVMLISDPSVKKSAAALSVAVGSFEEPTGFGGLAHYLEHMLFLGTKSYPKVGGYSDFLSRNGGFNNAYTALDHTNYMMTVNNSAYTEALHRFSGFFYEPLLTEKYADKERHAVNSEWTMKSPLDEVILEQLNGTTLHSEHPISRFNWGNLETLTDHGEQKLHTTLVDFYNQYYSANIMKAALISNLSLAELKTLASTYFSVIPNKNIQKPTVKAPVATPKELKKIVHYLPQTDQKELSLKFVIANNSDQFAVKPNKYVSYLLSNEMPGALTSTLRNLGLIENLSVKAIPSEYGNSGSFTIDVKLTAQGVNKKNTIIGLIFKYINLIKEQGIDQKYFFEIKQSLHNEFRFKEKVADYGYVWDIAAQLQKRPSNYALSSEYEYQHFNRQAITDVLKQLTIDNVRIFYIDKNQPVNKKMHFFKGQYSVENINEAMVANWQKQAKNIALTLPAVNGLMPEKFALVTNTYSDKPHALITEPDLNLYLGQSKYFNQPKGSYIANFNSNLSSQSPHNSVMASLFSQGVNLALSSLKAEAEAAGMGLEFYNKNGFTLAVDGFTEQQKRLLSRAYRIVRNYKPSNKQLANLKAAYLADKESAKKKMLISQLFPNLFLVMDLHKFDDKSLLAELNGVSAQNIADFRDDLLKRAHVNIFAFGNYSEQQATTTAYYLRDLLPENRQVTELYQSKLLHPKAGQVFNWQQDSELTDIAFVDVLLKPLAIPQYASVKVLSQILSPALFNQIRTEEQLGYSVGFFNRVFQDQLAMGFYIQSSVKGPAAVAKRIELFKQKFVKKLANITPEEFAKVKQSVLVTLTQPPKNISKESGSFYKDWLENKVSFDSKRKLIAAVKQVTLNDIKQAYQLILSTKEQGRVVVQFRGTNFKDKPFTEFDNVQQISDINSFHSKKLL